MEGVFGEIEFMSPFRVEVGQRRRYCLQYISLEEQKA